MDVSIKGVPRGKLNCVVDMLYEIAEKVPEAQVSMQTWVEISPEGRRKKEAQEHLRAIGKMR